MEVINKDSLEHMQWSFLYSFTYNSLRHDQVSTCVTHRAVFIDGSDLEGLAGAHAMELPL